MEGCGTEVIKKKDAVASYHTCLLCLLLVPIYINRICDCLLLLLLPCDVCAIHFMTPRFRANQIGVLLERFCVFPILIRPGLVAVASRFAHLHVEQIRPWRIVRRNNTHLHVHAGTSVRDSYFQIHTSNRSHVAAFKMMMKKTLKVVRETVITKLYR